MSEKKEQELGKVSGGNDDLSINDDERGTKFEMLIYECSKCGANLGGRTVCTMHKGISMELPKKTEFPCPYCQGIVYLTR